MVLPETSHSLSLSYPKCTVLHRAPSLIADGFLFVGGASLALILIWALFCSFNPNTQTHFSPATSSYPSRNDAVASSAANSGADPPTTAAFYDDPTLSFAIGGHVEGWDEKRSQWLKKNPSFVGTLPRTVLVSGSQPSACRNPVGDHLLLRLLKNKVDYCRIHGVEIFYNNALLHPRMGGFWAKYQVVKAAMLAHPEAELFGATDAGGDGGAGLERENAAGIFGGVEAEAEDGGGGGELVVGSVEEEVFLEMGLAVWVWKGERREERKKKKKKGKKNRKSKISEKI